MQLVLVGYVVINSGAERPRHPLHVCRGFPVVDEDDREVDENVGRDPVVLVVAKIKCKNGQLIEFLNGHKLGLVLVNLER